MRGFKDRRQHLTEQASNRQDTRPCLLPAIAKANGRKPICQPRNGNLSVLRQKKERLACAVPIVRLSSAINAGSAHDVARSGRVVPPRRNKAASRGRANCL